jgi:uncharacterized membrane protein YidH (DUF202 family)
MADRQWHSQETYKSMIQFGHEMLKYTFLVNGAAIISILTFIGNLQSKTGGAPSMKEPVFAFIVGIILSGLATVTTYIAQFRLYNESLGAYAASGLKSHMTWLYISLILIFASVFAFATGAYLAASNLL